ncbi:MAG: putative Fe-S cluster assembly protein SufT [Acidimicrobiales bacterium]
MTDSSTKVVELSRDCTVVLIPSGRPATLSQGDEVTVVQDLGGSFTVATRRGLLARVDGKDGDALGLTAQGLEAGQMGPAGPAGGPFALESVIEQLRTVFDPEIPVNVVDLGLVYSCEATALSTGGHRVEITMSMTAPGCGMGDVLREEAASKVSSLEGVAEVDVELVWDPPWDLSRISEEARLELGLW